jgi:ribosomal protein S18 acetylase RimI-like enzyme
VTSDHALSSRIEAVEAASIADAVRAVQRRLPDAGAAVITVAGGRAGFITAAMRLSRAAGLGMSVPVSREDVEAIEAFYGARACDARIVVSPFAHPSLFEHLGERGFRLEALDTVLVRRITPADRAPNTRSGVSVHRAADAAAWVRLSLTGFAPEGSGPALDRAPYYQAGFDDPGKAFLVAEVDGVAAGAGALFLAGDIAYFFAASTLPAYRGRGVQGALVAARLALAAEAGCELGYLVTDAGSGSQRNFERAGFTTAYSQAQLVKRYTTRTIA